MNYKKAIDLAVVNFSKAKIKTANLDAILLLSFVLKKDKEYILAYPEIKLEKKQEKQFFALAKLRAKRFPLAYILEYKEFYDRRFHVNKDVLIPRPETEKIIELALNKIKMENKNKVWNILELGTGSGCIAITLALELEKIGFDYKIIASDISNLALRIAKENLQNLKTQNIKFIKSDLFKNIKGKFDLILANLPYVKKSEIKDELTYEPILALEDKKQIPQILKEYKKYLKPKGILIYETINGKVLKII